MFSHLNIFHNERGGVICDMGKAVDRKGNRNMEEHGVDRVMLLITIIMLLVILLIDELYLQMDYYSKQIKQSPSITNSLNMMLCHLSLCQPICYALSLLFLQQLQLQPIHQTTTGQFHCVGSTFQTTYSLKPRQCEQDNGYSLCLLLTFHPRSSMHQKNWGTHIKNRRCAQIKAVSEAHI